MYRFNPFPKAKLTPTKTLGVTCLFLLLTGNGYFVSQFFKEYPVNFGNSLFLGSLMLVIGCLTFLLANLLSLLIPTRIVATVFLWVTAAASFFSTRFGTVFDAIMIRNIFETNAQESADLQSLSLWVHLVVFALVPTLLLWISPFQKAHWLKERLRMLKNAGLSLLIMALCLFAFNATFASFFRQHKPLRSYVNPAFPIYSAAKFLGSLSPSSHQDFKEKAKMAQIPEEDVHRELVIVVVGETARADHFSLNGYSRQTNPLLEQEPGVISYSDISACGTSTSISVPCMFSLETKNDFQIKEAKRTQNVLDLLAKAGVSILWRDNNSDSKGVATRFEYQDFKTPATNPNCDLECRDVGMLSGLQDYVNQQEGDILIILHQMGSHGPAYYKRYPKEFEHFQPACQTAELGDCGEEELINAYDNTIYYTDFFLAQVIAFLKTNTPAFETTMFYVSDHGESLGEHGMYLHGMPYFMAPDAQKKVPVILWANEGSDIDLPKTRFLKDLPNSHDAVARTLVELFEIQTDFEFHQTDALVFMVGEDVH